MLNSEGKKSETADGWKAGLRQCRSVSYKYIYVYETKSSRMFEHQQNDDEIPRRDR